MLICAWRYQTITVTDEKLQPGLFGTLLGRSKLNRRVCKRIPVERKSQSNSLVEE